MNQVQISIIALVVAIIIAIVAYHFYQENKFKRQINQGFNGRVEDALEQQSSIVVENDAHELNAPFQKDIFPDLHLQDAESKDSLTDLSDSNSNQAEFIHYNQDDFAVLDNALFDFKIGDYTHVIDIAFTKSIKLRMLPDMAQFCTKGCYIYILEKDLWSSFEKGKKYLADGIRVVINLVDEHGITSELQVTNAYNELEKFVVKYNAKFRQTLTSDLIASLQKSFKKYKQAALDLELFIVNHDYLPFDKLKQLLIKQGLIEQQGIFYKTIEGTILFYITDENGKPFQSNHSYRLLALNSKLHNFVDPMVAIDALFDLAEEYQNVIESRLLTSNKIIMKEHDYKSLIRQIELHFSALKRNEVEAGSELVRIICN